MENKNSVIEKTHLNAVESTEKSQTLTEACSVMKDEIKDEAQQIFAGHRDNVSKPKTITAACSTMKDEIKDEAQRIFPDPATHHEQVSDFPSEKLRQQTSV